MIQHSNQVNIHVSHYIDLFKPNSKYPNKERWLSNKKWAEFVQLSLKTGPSFHSRLGPSRINELLFAAEGTCAGFVIDYFSRFFQSGSPVQASPIPKGPLSRSKEGITFCSFKLDDETVEKQTSRARFLQAAYKLSSAFTKFPHFILAQSKLKLGKQHPDPSLKSKEFSYQMECLLPALKRLADPTEKKGYLLALGGADHHAIALHLSPPYHFVDEARGIALADSLDNLVLFLAGYIEVRYSCAKSFALLEFSPLNQTRQET